MLPVVRSVVTPAARYSRGAEYGISLTTKPGSIPPGELRCVSREAV